MAIGVGRPVQRAVCPKVLVLGPARNAVSGVSEHLNQLFGSRLSERIHLIHFQVGSEGRAESRTRRLWRLLSSPLWLAWWLVHKRIAAVHINTSINHRAFWRDLGYLFVAKALRKKVVYQVHGGVLPMEIGSRSALLRYAFSACLRLPDAIVVLTAEEESQYRATAGDTRVFRIPNAVDLVPYADFGPREYGQGTIRLAYIGRLAADKGIYETVEALAILVRRGTAVPLRLDIAGTGPEESHLRERVAEYGIGGYVRFLGAVFGEEKRRFWREADLFVFPTRHDEGLPYAVLESLAAGIPLVTTRVGGIPDAVSEGIHGVFLDAVSPASVADAIAALVADRERLRVMSAACRRRAAEQYGIARLEHQFTELYTEIFIDTHGPRGRQRSAPAKHR